MSESIQTINPSTDAILQNFAYASASETEAVLALSKSAFKGWSTLPTETRAVHLKKLADVLSEKRDELAELATREMGKLFTEAKAEVEKCANEAKYYADHGAAMLVDEKAPVSEVEAYVSYLPLGPILGVMPWNFPYWQVTRFAIPTLLAGNTIILKHASNVTGCALALEKVFLSAGFPKGVFQTLVTPSSAVKALIENPCIRGVSLTGSVGAGKQIAAQAGSSVKKSVLELGGSDAFIVLKDADLNHAVKAAISARFSNAGQVCIAAKRFIVVKEIAEEFEALFSAAIRALRTGDPFSAATNIGPMAKKELREELDAQVQKSIAMGAKLLVGGKKIPGPGNYYEPTLLSEVTTQMPVASEETFGPVAALITVKDVDSAIEFTNQSAFGLSSNLWTKDLDLARKLARRIEAGSVFINSFSHSDPRIPIGGIKQSGYGRELSHFGPREFTNVQTVWIDSR